MAMAAGCVGEGKGQDLLPRTLPLSPQVTSPAREAEGQGSTRAVCVLLTVQHEGRGGWGHFPASFLFFFCSASEWQGAAKPLDGGVLVLGRAQELGQVLLWLCVWVPRALRAGTRALCVLLAAQPWPLQCLTPAAFSLSVELSPSLLLPVLFEITLLLGKSVKKMSHVNASMPLG